MKLFIACGVYDYEGGEIIGVFDSEAKAKAAHEIANIYCDRREIYEVELNKNVSISIG